MQGLSRLSSRPSEGGEDCCSDNSSGAENLALGGVMEVVHQNVED